MFSNKTCCITGHRDFPVEKRLHIQDELEKALRLAIADGYTHFISGFARGIDLTFARLVAEYKQDIGGITLEAAIPYRNRLNSRDGYFEKYIKHCDKIHICTEAYHPSCFHKRNDYMLEKSSRLIAVYDGRQGGGTFSMIKKAEKLKRDVFLIQI
ncbi:DUF1273 domain-containing protein [Tyzzerella sp. OttesenSCG-928-J15]|nr:DUF1273 domain-containing protein [Tyzzerella sp. OttesenSCG-928-J15]